MDDKPIMGTILATMIGAMIARLMSMVMIATTTIDMLLVRLEGDVILNLKFT